MIELEEQVKPEEVSEPENFSELVFKQPVLIQLHCKRMLNHLLEKRIPDESDTEEKKNEDWQRRKRETVKSLRGEIEFAKGVEQVDEGYDGEKLVNAFESWIESASQDEMWEIKNKLANIDDPNFVAMPVWKPAPGAMEQVAKTLYEEGEIARKAFFLGNKKSNNFTREEIEEIKSHLKNLENKDSKA